MAQASFIYSGCCLHSSLGNCSHWCYGNGSAPTNTTSVVKSHISRALAFHSPGKVGKISRIAGFSFISATLFASATADLLYILHNCFLWVPPFSFHGASLVSHYSLLSPIPFTSSETGQCLPLLQITKYCSVKFLSYLVLR